MKLLYVMDPMCAWCYGFQPELEQFLKNYPSIEVDWVMGGLAPDTEVPMEEGMKKAISSYWYDIEQKTQVTFNHDYWQHNTPYRSTYQACRAVIAANQLGISSINMVKAIQSAYYRKAKNPSLDETLLNCAVSLGIRIDEFKTALLSQLTEQNLKAHLTMSRQLKVTGFPALFYISDTHEAYPLTLGYCEASILEKRFLQLQKS